MSPKEKAEELIDKFLNDVLFYKGEYSDIREWSIDCALITVKEI